MRLLGAMRPIIPIRALQLELQTQLLNLSDMRLPQWRRMIVGQKPVAELLVAHTGDKPG